MVYIKDVATYCGVSTATVSKALNNHQDISESTKQMVKQAADKLGYLPNAAARALKTNKTYNIGILYADDTSLGLSHEYFSKVLDAFKGQVEQGGYDVTFINQNIGGKTTSYLEHCQYRNLDGVCIVCANFNDPQIQELISSDVPVVTIDYSFHNTTSIVSDNASGMAELVRYVHKKGHKNIGFIHGENTDVTKNRLASFYRVCEELKLNIPKENVLQAKYHDPAATAVCTKKLLEMKNPPTCIFFPDDFSYIGGMNVILEAGLTIPQDVSCVGYDGIYLSQVLVPPLTTHKQNTEYLGSEAANQLMSLIENAKTYLPQRMTISGCLLEGKSVRQL